MLTSLLALLLVRGVPASAPLPWSGPSGVAEAGQDRLAANASVDDVLEALHKRGDHLTDFDADVTQTTYDPASGDATVLSGRVLFHRSAGGETKVRVTFDARKDGDKAPKPYKKEYALAGQWLVERDYARKRETRTQVLRPGEQIDLFKLGSGPFPLPIGQDPAEVKRQFTATRAEGEGDLPRVKLVPVAGTKLASKFAEIVVGVDPATRFPTSIKTDGASGSRLTELKNIRVNENSKLADGDFDLPAIGDDWDRSEQPLAD